MSGDTSKSTKLVDLAWNSVSNSTATSSLNNLYVLPYGGSLGASSITTNSSTISQAQLNQLYQQYYTGLGMPQMAGGPLSLKDAEDAMKQYDHDGILVKDKVLLFGLHTSKGLRDIPIEYVLGLNKAIRTLRRELLMEVRRRRVVERLPKR